jgi:hypothetical protein
MDADLPRRRGRARSSRHTAARCAGARAAGGGGLARSGARCSGAGEAACRRAGAPVGAGAGTARAHAACARCRKGSRTARDAWAARKRGRGLSICGYREIHRPTGSRCIIRVPVGTRSVVAVAGCDMHMQAARRVDRAVGGRDEHPHLVPGIRNHTASGGSGHPDAPKRQGGDGRIGRGPCLCVGCDRIFRGQCAVVGCTVRSRGKHRGEAKSSRRGTSIARIRSRWSRASCARIGGAAVVSNQGCEQDRPARVGQE